MYLKPKEFRFIVHLVLQKYVKSFLYIRVDVNIIYKRKNWQANMVTSVRKVNG